METKNKTNCKIFLLVGGDPKNLRAGKLVKRWKQENKNGVFLVTGYPNKDPGELINMVEYLTQNGVPKESIWIAGSYDTLSNVANVERMFNDQPIFISTGEWHWKRFKLIFKDYPGINVTFLPSGEKEIWYCIPIFIIYRLLTPIIWQKICKIIRRKMYELSNDDSMIGLISRAYGVNTI